MDLSVNERTQILVSLPPGCREGVFIRRHKRFSVEFEMDGERHWAHTNNTGAMLGLCRPGLRILVSPAANPLRKLPWTLERTRIETGYQKSAWAGVNTALPNMLFKKAFHAGLLDFAKDYTECKTEAIYGESRLDGCLKARNLPPLWVECKNVSLVEDNVAAFPDAESSRARKHLRELMKIRLQGCKALMLFIVQRPDCEAFAPADYVDPEYARLFYEAMEMGVEMLAWQATFTAKGSGLGKHLPILSQSECGLN